MAVANKGMAWGRGVGRKAEHFRRRPAVKVSFFEVIATWDCHAYFTYSRLSNLVKRYLYFLSLINTCHFKTIIVEK